MAPESERPRNRKSHNPGRKRRPRKKHESSSSHSGSQLLSADALAQLDRFNQDEPEDRQEEVTPKKPRRTRPRATVYEEENIEIVEGSPRRTHRQRPRDLVEEDVEVVEKPRREYRRRPRDLVEEDIEVVEKPRREYRRRPRHLVEEDIEVVEKPRREHRRRLRDVVHENTESADDARRERKRKSRRVVSGALLEEGDGRTLRVMRGGAGDDEYDEYDEYEKEGYEAPPKSKKKWLIIGGIVIVLIIVIVVAVVVSKKKSSSSADSSGTSSNSNLAGISESSIPAAYKGTYYDPFDWYDTLGFNVTFTTETVGGLPIMGLNSTWDDSARANDYVPALDTTWGSYADLPARGVNLGGWLSIEPFIAPSLFNYPLSDGIIDEWTLTKHLGADAAKSTLEKHYDTFVTEQTFADIAAAGLDHIRIPYSYWAVTTYEGDPYVPMVSWRYLLRGIEWARKYGLRINLDLHGLPGSQNGWNHSGRQGPIGWLNGTDGTLNANRSLAIHNQLSQFFAQDRYKNILAFYGLANEPKMTFLNVTNVIEWTASAYEIVSGNNITAYVVFGDGFLGLADWQGKLTGYSNLILDAHQYVIFDVNLLVFNHTYKIDFACTDWTSQAGLSMNTATGFGPTIFAEFSQADADCVEYLNNVGVGSRWTGTYDYDEYGSTSVLTPTCPTENSECSCTSANADSSSYSSAYKEWLLMFAEAQMTSFEVGWGWFYWTWVTEDATQWSYQDGMAAGILPAKAYDRGFNCSTTIPSYSTLPETY